MDIDTGSDNLYEDDPQADADWLAGADPAPEMSYTAHYADGSTYRGGREWPMDLVRFKATEHAARRLGGARIIAMIGVTR